MTITTIVILIIIGVLAGMLSGLVGVGGGLVIVPALVYFLAYSQKQAQGTSLAVLLLPVVVVSAFYYYKSGYMNVNAVPLIAVGFLFGGYFGGKLALVLPDATLKKVFAIVLILIAIKMLFIDQPKAEQPLENKATINKT
jgi:uncharacterized membrane protein YfcA